MVSINRVKRVVLAITCSTAMAFASSVRADPPSYPIIYTAGELAAALADAEAADQAREDYDDLYEESQAWNDWDLARMFCDYDFNHGGGYVQYLECKDAADEAYDEALDLIFETSNALDMDRLDKWNWYQYVSERCCLPE